MKRTAIEHLLRWKDKPHRKPLVIRGARQVGKTELVRIFAAEAFEELVELNFEETPQRVELFRTPDVAESLRLIRVDLGVDLVPGRSLLFLDEIQVVPELLARLRFFFERLPDLHIICAGSLLDFALAATTFSVPVGRLEFLHLGPMTFEEYLVAAGLDRLVEFLHQFQPGDAVPSSIHDHLLRQLREYLVVGGLPGVVKAFLETDMSHAAAAEEHQNIAQTFYLDFARYRPGVDVPFLQRIFTRIPTLIGRTVKYAHLDRDVRAAKTREALDLLTMSRVVTRVLRSDGNGVPLAAESSDALFKLLYLDVGLMNAALGLRLSDLVYEDCLDLHRGAVAEQFVGQHLLYQRVPNEDPRLFAWSRPVRGSEAEVDYLTASGTTVIPVEVKAGASGRLKSLHRFVSEKRSAVAVRFYTSPPELARTQTGVPGSTPREFTLLSLPLYLIDQLPRLVAPLVDPSRQR